MTENQNRTPAGVPTGGQFAASTKAEAAVNLAEPVQNPIADALSTLPGSVEPDGDSRATYTDPAGHQYVLYASDRMLGVRADDVHVSSTSIQMTGLAAGVSARQVTEMLARVQADAEDMRAFNVAVREWVFVPRELRGAGYRDPDLDVFASTAEFNGVTLAAFTSRHPETDGSALRVTVGATYSTEPGTEYEVLRMPDGAIRYVRNGDTDAPMASWERDALEGEIANRLDRGGMVAGLDRLLLASEQNVRKAAQGG